MKYRRYDIKNVTRSQLNNVIDEYIIGFKAERNRSILKRRLCDGITYDDLAEEYDMSVRQIKKIVYDSEQCIVKHLDIEID